MSFGDFKWSIKTWEGFWDRVIKTVEAKGPVTAENLKKFKEQHIKDNNKEKIRRINAF